MRPSTLFTFALASCALLPLPVWAEGPGGDGRSASEYAYARDAMSGRNEGAQENQPAPSYSGKGALVGPGSNQSDQFGGASNSAGSGAQDARGSAEAASAQSDADRSMARQEQDLQQQLAADHARLAQSVNPLLASTDQQRRARGNKILAQSTSPPENFSKAYELLGLSSNRDVLEKVPTYVKNLGQTSADWDQKATYWGEQAKQARNAADVMNHMQSATAQRGANLGSIDSGPGSSAAGVVGKSAFTSDDGSRTTLVKNSAVTATQPILRPDSPSKYPAPSKDRGTNTTSLRDQLKAHLAATTALARKNAEGKENAAEPKSTFDSLFEARNPASESAAELDPALAAAKRPFHMTASDTDQAVKKLVQNLEGSQLAEEKLFGNTDVTIFTRMSKYLTKAQSDKKVAH